MADDMQPLVLQALGTVGDQAYTVAWSDRFDRLAVSVWINDTAYLVVQDQWGQLSTPHKRFVIVHELVHMHGPALPFAIREGLADAIACRLVPEMASKAWSDHLAVQSRSALDAGDLFRQEPRSVDDEAELRALGFFTVYTLTPAEVTDLVTVAERAPDRMLLVH